MYAIQFKAAGSTEWRTALHHGSYSTEAAAQAKLDRLSHVPGFASRVGKVA